MFYCGYYYCYLVMSYNLAPIILSLTHTLLWHRRQLFLLPQSVSERVKRPNFCLFRLKFNYFGGPGSRLLLLAVADVGIHFPENVVNPFTRAWPLDRIWGRVPENTIDKNRISIAFRSFCEKVRHYLTTPKLVSATSFDPFEGL